MLFVNLFRKQTKEPIKQGPKKMKQVRVLEYLGSNETDPKNWDVDMYSLIKDFIERNKFKSFTTSYKDGYYRARISHRQDYGVFMMVEASSRMSSNKAMAKCFIAYMKTKGEII